MTEPLDTVARLSRERMSDRQKIETLRKACEFVLEDWPNLIPRADSETRKVVRAALATTTDNMGE
jgi:hypothetical protein